MNKLLLCTIVWFASAFCALAQQLPLLSQFQESAGVLNPAAISSTYLIYGQNVRISGTYHSQWTEIEGNPQTSQLVAEKIFDDYGPISPLVGVYFINDQVGPTGLSGLYGKIGGVITDDIEERGLSFALQAGINQYRLKISELELRQQETIYAANDDGRLYPDVGLGVFAYQKLDGAFLYAGLSAPQLLGLDLSFRGNDGNITTTRYRHYYGQIGAIIPMEETSFLEPVAWVKVVPGIPVNVSATMRYQTVTSLFIGLGGNTAKAIHGEVGFILGDQTGASPMCRIGYGIDYSIASFGPYAGATHEINLSYSFNQ